MKKFFEKASKPFALPGKPRNAQSPPLAAGTGPNIALPNQTPHLQPKYVVQPVPHPCPHEHLAIIATKAGLLIQPYSPGYNNGNQEVYIRISWGKHIRIEEINHRGEEAIDWNESIIVYGIVGTLELYSTAYLFVISSRSELGYVLEGTHAVYGVKSVSAVPLSEERARKAIQLISARNAALAHSSLTPAVVNDPSRDPEDDLLGIQDTPVQQDKPRVQFSPDPEVKVMTPQSTTFDPDEDSNLLRAHSPAPSSSSDISTPSSEHSVTPPVFKTLATRLSFWSRLSKRGSLNGLNLDSPLPANLPMSPQEEQEALDSLMKESQDGNAEVIGNILAATAPAPSSLEEQNTELEDKIVRECIREFSKGGMYFSYTFDITRSLQHKQERVLKSQKEHELLSGLGALPSPESSSSDTAKPKDGDKVWALVEPYHTLPLWRRVDRQFWWNEWLSKPFIDAGLHPYVLPLMQGYFQVTKFIIPPDPITHDEEVPVDYIIISRRSRDRAGLRYQRRGIDDDAHVANFVETEAIMRVNVEGIENIFSYIQIRGSIPLYWTQGGYGLKPPPVLASDRTHQQNLDAMKKHLNRTIPQYGPHTIVNLAEQHGKEGAITKGYRDYMHEFKSADARYCEYDFHNETKGMKYENISKLIEAMERTFEAQGYLWISENTVLSQQKGVFRVNCIDCLDRTNVVQSAFSRYVLNKQLGAVALFNPSGVGKPEIDMIFNDVWANNGDAISRAYAGTSALKGDFTRTGKRDLSGLLNDGVNSLARMYSSTFSDWFCQAVIDFMLGNRTISVFSEFLLKLQSSDPRDLIRLSKIRAEAIATSVSRVLPERERLLSGWTLFSPEEFNSKFGHKFEEKVLLLSSRALYIVSYDYTLEKVKVYTRVPLGDIIKISKGAYILSPLEEASRDPGQNAGFVVTWLNSNQETRATSYSLRNDIDLTRTTSLSSNPLSPSVDNPLSSSMFAKVRRNTLPPLSNILAKTAATTIVDGPTTFCAFKVLPIDPARIRRLSSTSSGMYADVSDELSSAASCKEAADLIVDSIQRACQDIGGGQGEFVVNEDVVSLSEAQKMTSVYAKMEYGVKRLLWLGG
ncbi:SacI homology domain-containing protein [Cyathus striatus]|nr:SacI homology domain-containing protein [Cyathus striatus]